MNYPEDTPGWALCHMEGHVWDKGTCVRCGDRLRCFCGCYMQVDGFEKHMEKCRVVRASEPGMGHAA